MSKKRFIVIMTSIITAFLMLLMALFVFPMTAVVASAYGTDFVKSVRIKDTSYFDQNIFPAIASSATVVGQGFPNKTALAVNLDVSDSDFSSKYNYFMTTSRRFLYIAFVIRVGEADNYGYVVFLGLLESSRGANSILFDNFFYFVGNERPNNVVTSRTKTFGGIDVLSSTYSKYSLLDSNIGANHNFGIFLARDDTSGYNNTLPGFFNTYSVPSISYSATLSRSRHLLLTSGLRYGHLCQYDNPINSISMPFTFYDPGSNNSNELFFEGEGVYLLAERGTGLPIDKLKINYSRAESFYSANYSHSGQNVWASSFFGADVSLYTSIFPRAVLIRESSYPVLTSRIWWSEKQFTEVALSDTGGFYQAVYGSYMPTGINLYPKYYHFANNVLQDFYTDFPTEFHSEPKIVNNLYFTLGSFQDMLGAFSGVFQGIFNILSIQIFGISLGVLLLMPLLIPFLKWIVELLSKGA